VEESGYISGLPRQNLVSPRATLDRTLARTSDGVATVFGRRRETSSNRARLTGRRAVKPTSERRTGTPSYLPVHGLPYLNTTSRFSPPLMSLQFVIFYRDRNRSRPVGPNTVRVSNVWYRCREPGARARMSQLWWPPAQHYRCSRLTVQTRSIRLCDRHVSRYCRSPAIEPGTDRTGTGRVGTPSETHHCIDTCDRQ
jgi:hypothetical protein